MTVGLERTGKANLAPRACTHMGHVWVGAAGVVLVTQALRVASFLWASVFASAFCSMGSACFARLTDAFQASPMC